MKKQLAQSHRRLYLNRVAFLSLVTLFIASFSWAAIPSVSNIQVQQVSGSSMLDISYDLQDDDGDAMHISAVVSLDGGSSWTIPCGAVSGDIGGMIMSGIGHEFQWDASADVDDFVGDDCRVRIFATDVSPYPVMEYFRIVGTDTLIMSSDNPDTLGFGHPLHLMWRASTPVLDGLPSHVINSMDTVFPFNDGLLGYQWQAMEDGCDPEVMDCWHPRFYDQASGDSVSYFAENDEFVFQNNGAGFDVFSRVLDSGELAMRFNTVDIAGTEIVQPVAQEFSFVVNYDPETILLKGQADWAHPEDPEVYPYYTLLNDPEQIHYPFSSGERIPDRSYVVFKALYRDDSRDQIVNPAYSLGLTGNFSGVMTLSTGGFYSFSSGASSVDLSPAWDEGIGGFYADTLGFMVAPSTEFTFRMSGVDEHGRRDGTPDEMSFHVGFPPCVQCLEFLPGSAGESQYPEDLVCYDPDAASHPCFGETSVFYIQQQSSAEVPGRTYLQQTYQNVFMGINKLTGLVDYSLEPQDENLFYVFNSRVFDMGVLLHGRDDPREAWSDPVLRTMAWRYQIDYDCDPSNSIADGGGIDNIYNTTFGYEFGDTGIAIDEDDGLWRLGVDIVVPESLLNHGPDVFRLLIEHTMASGDAELADELFNKCIRQLSSGKMRAVALDQTRCGFSPVRPGMYHIFSDVRPSSEGPGAGTWRDCDPEFGSVDWSINLSGGAMSSNETEPVENQFRIIFQGLNGDLSCQIDGDDEGPALPISGAAK